uniref:Uncharacterized protein n=1 Tax=Phytophthora fragariae TaxID=53985 RepID=A0A6A3DJY1_9STRA|nr:hypothetical protein PF009_g31248 [Phytophthora fragariae]
MNNPTVPSGAATASSTCRQVCVCTRCLRTRRTCTVRSASSSVVVQLNGTTFLSPPSYHFISQDVKSILTPFCSIQSSPSRNSSAAPSTTNASTGIICPYCVVNSNRHTPSTLATAPVKPPT